MEYLESLGQKLSEVTMYDVKSAIAQAKAVAMNWTEYEQKARVRRSAFWADVDSMASRSLVHPSSDALQGREHDLDERDCSRDAQLVSVRHKSHTLTVRSQHFNEIMPTIYKRFTEKEARQWRQIYKSLQLLEYLVKHGSERVVDDARSHVSMIKILRNFHYVDEKGKDQGINVRNRSKELAELLSDLDRVRQERRKAKANKNKYGGISNEDVSFTTASGSRYGGFGSEQLAARGSGVDTGSSSRSSGFRDTSANEHEEYDAGDDDDRTASRSSAPTKRTSLPAAKAPPPPPQKEVNLFDFDDDEPAPAPVAAKPAPAAFSAPAPAALDDDFDDFVAAPGQPSAPAAPSQPSMPSFAAPSAGAPKPTFFDMMGGSAAAAATIAQPQPYISRPGGTMSPPISATPLNPALGRPMLSATNSASSVNTTRSAPPVAAAAAPSKGAAAFDDLWTMAGPTPTPALGAKKAAGPSMAALSKQPGSTGIWASSSATPSYGQPAKPMNGGASSMSGGFGSANDDLLL